MRSRNWIRVIGFTAAIAPTATTAYAGVNRWTSGGPDVPGVRCLAIDSTDPNVVYAGTLRGVFKSINGGLSWINPSSGKFVGTDVQSLAIDPATPSSVYAGTASGVFKSTDGAVSWTDANLTAAIYTLLIPTRRPSTIFAVDFDGAYYPGPSVVYKSTDNAETWSKSAGGLSIVPGTLVIDPAQPPPSTLYTASSYGDVYKSVDAGATWRLTGFGLARAYVWALVIDPGNPTTLYAATYLGVYKSVDAGATWRLASGDLAGASVRALAIDPQNSRTLYAGTFNRGVFRSTDGGQTWTPFNDGLSDLGVTALAIDRTGTRLHVGTRSGVFDYRIWVGALGVSVGTDSTTRILSVDALGATSLRTFNASGDVATVERYGPYAGWSAGAVADGPDGLTRVLWNNLDGSIALWLVGPGGNQASYRFGPVAGWTARDVSVSSASTTHILWTNIDGRVALWELDNSGALVNGAIYGPYTGWTARAISDGRDDLTRLLWTKDDGSAGLSLIGPRGIFATYRFEPIGGWRAQDLTVASDNQARILWADADGRMSLWAVNNSGGITPGPIYAAPDAQAASRISAGTDGLTRVLWTTAEGTGSLWLMGSDNSLQNSFGFGPD